MKERPILFSAPMVRAILAGTKTQTRRVYKPRPQDNISDPLGPLWSLPSPYGAPGDRLWVRETWYCDDFTANDFAAARSGYVDKPPSDERIIEQWRRAMDYRADHDCHTYEAGCPCSDEDGRSCWRPSIFMPRWASRITLEVTGVRVERLQAITPAAAEAEGIGFEDTRCDGECGATPCALAVPRFADLWRKINGAASWDANPWVWVVEFRRVEAQERAA